MCDRVASVKCPPQIALLRAIERLERELRVLEEARDISDRSVREIVHPDDFVTVVEQALTDVRADEARCSGDPDSPHVPLLVQRNNFRSGLNPSKESCDGTVNVSTRRNSVEIHFERVWSKDSPKAPWS